MDFVEICNVCARKVIIKAAKIIINFDKMCHSYSDLNFGVTFFGTHCIMRYTWKLENSNSHITCVRVCECLGVVCVLRSANSIIGWAVALTCYHKPLLLLLLNLNVMTTL